MPEKELNLFIVRRTSKMVVESSEYTCKVNIQTECQVRPLLGSTQGFYGIIFSENYAKSVRSLGFNINNTSWASHKQREDG